MSDNVQISMDLLREALSALEWKFVRESEEEVSVTFKEPSKPTIHISLKVIGKRVVATSAIDVPVPRDLWGATLVGINEFNAKNYRPKVYLSLVEDSEAGMLMGEELHEAPAGTTSKYLAGWIGAHTQAFAMGAQELLGVTLR